MLVLMDSEQHWHRNRVCKWWWHLSDFEFIVVRRYFLWEALEIIQFMNRFGHYLDGKETAKKKKKENQHMFFFTVLFRLKDAKSRLPARLQKAQGYGGRQGDSAAYLDVLACGPQQLLL